MNRIKRYLIVLVGTLLFPQGAYSQFVWQPQMQPRDSSGTTYDFASLSGLGNRCVAAAIMNNGDSSPTERSVFFYTSDAGLSWSRSITYVRTYQSFFENRIRAIQILDSANVIAVGDTMVLRSYDAGAHWEEIHCPIRDQLVAVHFSDTSTGVMISSIGYMLMTTDGGKRWDTIMPFGKDYPVNCHSDGPGRFRIFTHQYGRIYSTSDNGKHFDTTRPIMYVSSDTSKGPDHNRVFNNWTVSGETIYAYGRSFFKTDSVDRIMGLLAISSDNGQHWRHIELADSFYQAVGCTSQIDRDTIFVGGAARERLLRSNDGGRTWQFDSIRCTFNDSNYAFFWSVGFHFTNDGHPIAAFGYGYGPGGGSPGFIARGHFGSEGVDARQIPLTDQLYPNPATTFLRGLNGTDRPVSLIDALGRAYLVPRSAGTLDISTLPPGVYYISDGTHRARFVKE